MGKTRLSLELAHAQNTQFEEGAYFVALDGLEDAQFIPSEIASTLSINLETGQEALRQVISHIADSELLLVLDNYEHVMQGAELVASLLEACPRLKIVVTSRERLQLEEEWLLRLEGLPFPQEKTNLEEALQFAAVELFLQRAQKLNADFELNTEQLEAVLGICRLVSGLPLAIELAAAWTNLMSPQDILVELQESYDFLDSRSRSIAERHRSLRAVFNYSWQLLNEKEKLALKRLAVFRGTIDYDAYKSVTQLPLSVLAGLVDKSLLQAISSKQVQNHSVLLSYMQEKLEEDTQEMLSTQERHGQHFLDLLIDKGDKLHGAKQKEAMQQLGDALDNIRAAWQWAYKGKHLSLLEQAAEALRFYFHLFLFLTVNMRMPS